MTGPAVQSTGAVARPLVSIGIPVFNGERYLDDALESALAQAYEPFEVVVVDNASSDGTQAIVRRWAARYPQVRYFRNARNVGQLPNFRRALLASRGEYFTWLAHDDLLSDSRYIETLVSYMEQNADVVLCATGFNLLDYEMPGSFSPQYLSDLHPDRSWRDVRREFFRWPQTVASYAVYGFYRREPLVRVMRSTRLRVSDKPLLCPEIPILTRLCSAGRILALPVILRSSRDVYPSQSWQILLTMSPFELCCVGFSIKLAMLRNAAKLPVPLPEKAELLGQTLGNFIRGNVERPRDVRPIAARRCRELGTLLSVAEERQRLVEELTTAVSMRRRLLGRVADTQSQAEVGSSALPAVASASQDIRTGRAMLVEIEQWLAKQSPIRSFFERPTLRAGELCGEANREIGHLRELCELQLETIRRLSDEAEELLLEMQAAATPSRGLQTSG